MNKDPFQFDDPVLRGALKRAVGRQDVPPSLRRKVANVFAHAGIEPAHRPAASPARQLWRPLAAAAVLLLAIGLAAYVYLPSLFSTEPAVAQALPAKVIAGMVSQHDACAKLPDHHLLDGITGNDFARIAQALQAQLRRPVIAGDLGDGWVFRGAGVCKVANSPAGHLLFTRGQQSVSVYSMPPIAYASNKSGGNYELVKDGHPIAGFTTRAGLFCVVGYDPQNALTLEEVTALRDAVRPTLTAMAQPPAGACAARPMPVSQ